MKTAQEYFDEGVNFTKNSEWSLAIDSFRKAIEASPNKQFPIASFKIGNVYGNISQYDLAIENFQKAIQDSENNKYPRASNNLGLAYKNRGQYDLAIESFQKTIQDSENNKLPEASNNLGIVHDERGQYDLAIESYLKAIEDSEKNRYPEASFNLGLVYMNRGQYDLAIESYLKAIEDSENKKFHEASFNLGLVYMNRGQYDLAIESYLKAIEDSENKKFHEASYNLGLVYMNRGQYDLAIKSNQKAIEDSENKKFPEAFINLGISYVNRDQYDLAIESFQKAIHHSENNKYPKASHYLGNIYCIRGQYDLAIEGFQKAIEDSENNKYPKTSNNLGIAYKNRGQYDLAIESFQKAIQDSENNKFPEASNNLGVAYKNRGQYDLAIQSYQKAIEDSIEEIYPEAHFSLSEVYWGMGAKDKSEFHCFKAICQNSNLLKAFLFLLEKFPSPKSEAMYRSRVNLLELQLTLKVTQSKEYESERKRLIETLASVSATDLYAQLLIRKDDIFNTGWSSSARLRRAYLVFASLKKWEWVFYIIDHCLDNEDDYNFDEMDKYFYLLSANATACSEADLRSILRSVDKEYELQQIDTYLCQVDIPQQDLSDFQALCSPAELPILELYLDGKPFESNLSKANLLADYLIHLEKQGEKSNLLSGSALSRSEEIDKKTAKIIVAFKNAISAFRSSVQENETQRSAESIESMGECIHDYLTSANESRLLHILGLLSQLSDTPSAPSPSILYLKEYAITLYWQHQENEEKKEVSEIAALLVSFSLNSLKDYLMVLVPIAYVANFGLPYVFKGLSKEVLRRMALTKDLTWEKFIMLRNSPQTDSLH